MTESEPTSARVKGGADLVIGADFWTNDGYEVCGPFKLDRVIRSSAFGLLLQSGAPADPVHPASDAFATREAAEAHLRAALAWNVRYHGEELAKCRAALAKLDGK